MTTAQQATYARQYLRWHVQQERLARRLVSVRLNALFDRVISNIERSNAELVLSVLDSIINEQEHFSILNSIYTSIVLNAAEREYTRLVPQKAKAVVMLTKDRDVPERTPQPGPNDGSIRIGFLSATWRNRLAEIMQGKQTATRVKQITDTTRKLIRDVLVQGVSETWDVRKVARKLRSSLGGSALRARALLIARTETTRAANMGHEIGAMSTTLKLNKIWIATYDGRTREAHAVAGKLKPVSRDGFFLVGGKKMKYPGDPNGGAAQVCGCRCVVSYIPALNTFE